MSFINLVILSLAFIYFHFYPAIYLSLIESLNWLITCVTYCVTWYFISFIEIFNMCLYLIIVLISKYLQYLSILTITLTSWPTNLIFSISACIMLYIIKCLIVRIFPFKKNYD